MFETQQKYTGTQYTTTVASLIGAFIFSPLVLIAVSPFSYVSLLLALFCSCLCLGLAWVSWKHAELTIPSLEVQHARAR